jgi:hypothetical protein
MNCSAVSSSLNNYAISYVTLCGNKNELLFVLKFVLQQHGEYLEVWLKKFILFTN